MKLGVSLLVGVLIVAGGFVGWKLMTKGETLHADQVSNLPWQSVMTATGTTQVFGVEIGKVTFRQFSETIRSIPEIGVFETPKGVRTLEGYFGKQRLGLFEAKLVAELNTDQATLDSFVSHSTERKAQPTGTWRYELAESDVKLANDMVIRYLIYMPVVNYDNAIIEQRFGIPADIIKTGERVTWWFYPDKGLIIMQDQDGGDIFYYSAKADYAALKQRAMTKPSTDR